MSRSVRKVILAAVTLCSFSLTGCSSNPSGVITQDPTPSTTRSSTAGLSDPSSSSGAAVSSEPISPSTSASGSSSSSLQLSSSPITTTSPTESASASAHPADPEATARLAIEAVWTKYWITVKGLMKVPVGERLTVMEAVAVPALAGAVVSRTAKEEAAGQAEYGSIVHRPYWSTPVAGKSTAVMNDCMNDYNAGTLDVKTGKPIRAGIYRDNTRGTFMKGSDGIWRVAKAEFLVNVPC